MGNNQLYWTKQTNDAVDKFVSDKSLNHNQLNRLYTNELYEPLDNMIRAIIHKYKLYYSGTEIDELMNVGHSIVYENLLKSREHENKYYNPQRNSSFHYYTTVIKNELVRIQKQNQKDDYDIATYEVDSIAIEDEDTSHHAEFMLKVSLDWLENNYDEVFTHWIDKSITKSFIEAVRTEGFNIDTIKGLSSVVLKYSDLEEHVFYSRYYETRTVHNEVYSELRRKYNNGERISEETEIELYKVY